MMLGKAKLYIVKHGVASFVLLLLKNLKYYFRTWLDERFDRKYQVETVGKVDLTSLTINSLNRLDGIYYEPTPERAFHSIMRSLKINYENYHFVDYGSGKGRVILMASRYPFKMIVGVEFGGELAEVANKNIVKFNDPKQRCHRIVSLCMDAVDYDIPIKDIVLYFYNPFKSDVMELIVEKLKTSYTKFPRNIVVVYYHPQSSRLFDKLDFLTKVESSSRVVDFTSPHFRGVAVYKTNNMATK